MMNQTRMFFMMLLVSVSFSLEARASDKALNVITTIPDLADIAREIGGKHVNVESMTRGVEDLHAVLVRPSLAAKLGRADVLIEIGLGLEHAFLPSLVEAANNPKIKREGRIVASEGMVPKDVPTVVSRSEGEQHTGGNPHVNAGPDAGRVMATNICNGLSANRPKFNAEFQANLKQYLEKLERKETEWREKGAKLKGVKFVSYHPDFVYFADYFGMEQVGTLEPKPGIPPSAKHTNELIKQMKTRGVTLIIREPQFSDKLPNHVAAQTGAKVAKVAIMVNGLPEAKTWIEMIDANLGAILKAVQE